MSELVQAFSESRKWRVRYATAKVRQIWLGVAVAPRVRRNQWESVFADATDALGTLAATSDDQWSRELAQRALSDLAIEVRGWSK